MTDVEPTVPKPDLSEVCTIFRAFLSLLLSFLDCERWLFLLTISLFSPSYVSLNERQANIAPTCHTLTISRSFSLHPSPPSHSSPLSLPLPTSPSLPLSLPPCLSPSLPPCLYPSLSPCSLCLPVFMSVNNFLLAAIDDEQLVKFLFHKPASIFL